MEQARNRHGVIEDPLMLCPLCRVEFRARGMRFLAARPPGELGDGQLEDWAAAFVRALG
jgi:hypothetical protein